MNEEDEFSAPSQSSHGITGERILTYKVFERNKYLKSELSLAINQALHTNSFEISQCTVTLNKLYIHGFVISKSQIDETNILNDSLSIQNVCLYVQYLCSV